MYEQYSDSALNEGFGPGDLELPEPLDHWTLDDFEDVLRAG